VVDRVGDEALAPVGLRARHTVTIARTWGAGQTRHGRRWPRVTATPRGCPPGERPAAGVRDHRSLRRLADSRGRVREFLYRLALRAS
jgi:hypothetical protein